MKKKYLIIISLLTTFLFLFILGCAIAITGEGQTVLGYLVPIKFEKASQVNNWKVVKKGDQQGFASVSHDDTGAGTTLGTNSTSGCMKIECNFEGTIGQVGDNFTKGAVSYLLPANFDFTGKTIRVDLKVPQSLIDVTGDDYGFQIFIKSGDYIWDAENFANITSAVWTEYTWDLGANAPVYGYVDGVIEVGFQITKDNNNGALADSEDWSGNIYLDDVEW